MKKIILNTSKRRKNAQIIGLIAHALPIIGAMALASTASAADCIDSSKIVANPIIPQVVKYVCGCNDFTYQNSYEATAKGVVSYTEGACPSSILKNMHAVYRNSAVDITKYFDMEAPGTAQLSSYYGAPADWSVFALSSSEPETATISASGEIKALAAGKTIITVQLLTTGETKTFGIIVSETLSTDLKSMYLTSSQLDIYQTTTVATAANCNCVINWGEYMITTSNPDVAKFEKGQILAIAEGTTDVIVTKTATGQSVALPLTIIKQDGMEDMYLANSQIVAGNTTYITWNAKCKCQVDWTRYTATSSVPEVATADAAGQITGISAGTTIINVTEISSGKQIGFPLTVVPLSGDVSVLADMYFNSDSIVLGSATRINCRQSVGIDWTKFAATSSAGLSVTADGIVRGLKLGNNTLTVKHIATNTQRTFNIRVTYKLYDVEHVEMYVGDTVNVPINRDYAEYFDIQVDGADYFKFDAANFTATATAVGAGYAGVLFYYKSDNTFAEGLKFLIKEKTAVTPVGDASVLADMYLGRNSIELGDTTNLFCTQNVQIDWSKFSITSFDGPTVKDGVITGNKTNPNAVIVVKHIASNTQRKFTLSVNYNYFTTDHIEMNVGDTVKVPVNPDYARFFYLDVVGADYFKFDQATMTATATAVGDGYAGVLCYYKSDNTFAQGIKFTIKDTASTVVKPEIKTVKLLNGGYTLEITFDSPIALYPGIEADFAVAMNNTLKANGTYTVTKVMAKEGNPNTLVLVMAEAVPVEGFTVQYKTSKAFAVATSVAGTAAESAMLYPNPAQNSVNFNAEGLIEATISTIGGQLILSENADSNNAAINISQLPAGQYIATFVTANGTVTQMLTVK